MLRGKILLIHSALSDGLQTRSGLWDASIWVEIMEINCSFKCTVASFYWHFFQILEKNTKSYCIDCIQVILKYTSWRQKKLQYSYRSFKNSGCYLALFLVTHVGLKLKLEEMKVRAMQVLSASSDSEEKWIRLRVCFDSFSGKIWVW